MQNNFSQQSWSSFCGPGLGLGSMGSMTHRAKSLLVEGFLTSGGNSETGKTGQRDQLQEGNAKEAVEVTEGGHFNKAKVESVAQCVLSMCEALCVIPNTTKGEAGQPVKDLPKEVIFELNKEKDPVRRKP